MMARKIVFTADDFGLSASTNDAIMASHLNGALNAAVLMTHQPGTEEAAELTRTHPNLSVGMHFHLTDSQPATREAWPWGTSPAGAGWAIGLSRRARRIMVAELRAQWEAYLALSIRCDFITFHHHLHLHPFIWHELVKLIGDYRGWIRMPVVRHFDAPQDRISRTVTRPIRRRRARSSGLKLSDTLWGVGRTFCMDASEVQQAIKSLPGTGIHEFVFHPRQKDDADSLCLLELKTALAETTALPD